VHRHHAIAVHLEPLDGSARPHLAAGGLDLGPHRVPHLARTQPRVVELGDQRLHVAGAEPERLARRGDEREALDALGGPLRA
jgi:hypothetical protein